MNLKDDFLPQYRNATANFEASLRNGIDTLYLHDLGLKLCDEVRAAILRQSEIGKMHLKGVLIECLQEQRYAETKFICYRDGLVKSEDYEMKYLQARETYSTIEDVLTELLVMLANYFPDAINKQIALSTEAVLISDLIKRFLPGWHFVIKELRTKAREKQSNQVPLFTGKLRHAQIAILHHMTGQPITKNNCQEIAKQYGQKSGQKLLEYYENNTSSLTRTAKGKVTIQNYKAIIPLLSGKAKEQAERELEDAIINNKK